MSENTQKLSLNSNYISKKIFEFIFKIVIALFYWIEKSIESFHREKKYKSVLLMYLIFLLIGAIISAFIVHTFIIISLYFINTKSQINFERYKDSTTFAKTLILCSMVILACHLQNIFNEHYNPMKKVRILIQALLYKFNIKKFGVMITVNFGVFASLFFLIKEMINSYIKDYNISVDILNQIEIFELLITFIIFYFIYVWAIEDSIIRAKRRLFLYILSSLFLVFTTANSLYELLVKSEYNNLSFSYMKFIILIVALLASVDKVFDSLKGLEKVYNEILDERGIQSDKYSFDIYNEVIEYKKGMIELLRNKIKQFLNELNEIKKLFLLLNAKQRLEFFLFMSICIIFILLILFMTFKLDSFISADNIKSMITNFIDKLPKSINVGIHNIFNSILKIITYGMCIIIPLIACIGAVKSINKDIKIAIYEKYSIGLFIRDMLCNLTMNLIITLVSILMLFIFIFSLLNININSFIRYFILFTINPVTVIFIVSFIYKKLFDKVDEYKNKL